MATIIGDGGNNTLMGTSGNDFISGLDGDDSLIGSGGQDTLDGGAGNDTFQLGKFDGPDSIDGGSGFDQISIVAGSLLLDNTTDAQLVNVEAVSAANAAAGVFFTLLAHQSEGFIVTGSSFNDTLGGGFGANTLAGGLGDDTYFVHAGDVVIENPGEGTDTIKEGMDSYTLGDNFENLVLTNGPGIQGHVGNGNAGDNSITGTNYNDTIDGGAGADTMAGGLGDDTYIVDNVNDVVVETGGGNTIDTSLNNFTLPANVHSLVFTGVGDFYGAGGSGPTFITGGAGNDTLDGGSGDADLRGGAGNDLYLIETQGFVSIFEAPGAAGGIDTIETNQSSFMLPDNVENLVYVGTVNFIGYGNSGDNSIAGGDGDDPHRQGWQRHAEWRRRGGHG